MVGQRPELRMHENATIHLGNKSPELAHDEPLLPFGGDEIRQRTKVQNGSESNPQRQVGEIQIGRGREAARRRGFGKEGRGKEKY